ncbi:hypothetical protein [Spectribacter hydrogenoxidans]|uniref:Uncharacterized protein n=1 Tax=Spectribacter hydrogenoxidans TaxID=3075608 RepID=A0ABU3C0Y1_9GAMM|nr:hypothetical protein [Salinisphaera sp. W335]MDT0635044.1 hypothetical protein [Salinisphaera sp. W335]
MDYHTRLQNMIERIERDNPDPALVASELATVCGLIVRDQTQPPRDDREHAIEAMTTRLTEAAEDGIDVFGPNGR